MVFASQRPLLYKIPGQHLLNYPPSLIFRYLERLVRSLVYLPPPFSPFLVEPKEKTEEKAEEKTADENDAAVFVPGNGNLRKVERSFIDYTDIEPLTDGEKLSFRVTASRTGKKKV